MGSLIDTITDKLMFLPGIIVALSFHEYAHAKVALACGDDTAERMGRVTLDPRAHIDPFGFISLLLIGFGWGKPVMVNSYRFKNKKLGSILVGLAGVTMNFALSWAFMALLWAVMKFAPISFLTGKIGGIATDVISYAVIVNLSLMLFNLLPIPPLDGYGVLSELLDLDRTRFGRFMAKYGTVILIVALVADVPSRFLSAPLSRIYSFMIKVFFSSFAR